MPARARSLVGKVAVGKPVHQLRGQAMRSDRDNWWPVRPAGLGGLADADPPRTLLGLIMCSRPSCSLAAAVAINCAAAVHQSGRGLRLRRSAAAGLTGMMCSRFGQRRAQRPRRASSQACGSWLMSALAAAPGPFMTSRVLKQATEFGVRLAHHLPEIEHQTTRRGDISVDLMPRILRLTTGRTGPCQAHEKMISDTEDFISWRWAPPRLRASYACGGDAGRVGHGDNRANRRFPSMRHPRRNPPGSIPRCHWRTCPVTTSGRSF